MLTMKGIAVSPGIAKGTVIIFDTLNITPVIQTVAEPKAEYKRALAAIRIAGEQLSCLFQKALTDAGKESAEIFSSHMIMLEDTDFLDCIREIIENNSCSAEYGVYAAGKHFITLLGQMEDAYMRERTADMKDLSHRIIRILSDQKQELINGITSSVIIASQELLPSQTLLMDKSRVLAFVSKNGSRNSHASILARSLGIPSVTDLRSYYDQINTGDQLIVDGINGLVILNPDQDTMLKYENKPAFPK